MKTLSLILSGLLLIAGPAGAATIASTDLEPTRQHIVIAPPMRATDLFTVPAGERIKYPDRSIAAQSLNEDRLSPPSQDYRMIARK